MGDHATPVMRSEVSSSDGYYPRRRYVYPPDASISLVEPYKQDFSKQAHSKHRGLEPQIAQTNIMHLMSDRDPLAVIERMSRINSHSQALANDPSIFKGKKDIESFANYMEQANIMKDVLGSSRQIRDPDDVCPPVVGYSYSRIKKALDNRPDCYDYDDQWFDTRTRGYSPGHVRSLSPPPADRTERWLNTLDDVNSTVHFDTQRSRQSHTRGQPILSTRFSSIALGKEWSRHRKMKDIMKAERRNILKEARKERRDNHIVRMDTINGIKIFENNNWHYEDSEDEEDE